MTLFYLEVPRNENSFLTMILKPYLHIEEAMSLFKKCANINNENQGRYTPESLVDRICQIKEVSIQELVSRRKTRRLTDTRAMVSTAAREMFPNMSFQRIADLTGRNHSTIFSHIRAVNDTPDLRKEYRKLRITLEKTNNE